jgi:hypothetical protein
VITVRSGRGSAGRISVRLSCDDGILTPREVDPEMRRGAFASAGALSAVLSGVYFTATDITYRSL